MTSQSRVRFAIVVAALMFVSRDVARAEEPAKNPQAVGLQSTPSVTFDFTNTGVAWSPAGHALNFIAATHGNPLGVEVAAVDKALAAQLGLADNNGVVVTAVPAGSEAAKAGLTVHDVVLKVGDRPVIKSEKFHEIVKAEQGKDVQVHVVRQGKPATLMVKLPAVPIYELALQPMQSFAVHADNQYRIGVTLAAADDTLRSQLRLASGEGLVVTEVVTDGPAAKAGVKKHDVLTMLDGKRLTTVDGINSQVQSIKDRKVAVIFVRGGAEMSRELAPQLSTTPAVIGLSSAAYTNTFLGQLQNRNLVWERYAVLQPNATALGAGNLLLNQQPYVQWSQPTTAQPHTAAKPATPAEQIAALKKQLAEMQKTLQTLEAALQQPAIQKQPPAETAKKK